MGDVSEEIYSNLVWLIWSWSSVKLISCTRTHKSDKLETCRTHHPSYRPIWKPMWSQCEVNLPEWLKLSPYYLILLYICSYSFLKFLIQILLSKNPPPFYFFQYQLLCIVENLGCFLRIPEEVSVWMIWILGLEWKTNYKP